MALRPQTSPLLRELLALGVLRMGDSGDVYGPDNVAVTPVGPMQTNSPIAGATVNMVDDARSGTLYLTPAGTLATLTVALPSDAKSVLNQEEKIISSQAITALTLTQIGGGQTILGAPAGMTAGQTLICTKVAANTWAVK